MAAVISLKGIDEAIANLNYRNETSLKFRLVHTVRNFHEHEGLESLASVDTNELIKILWYLEHDHELIKKKRKNLSAIKWSINEELKKLYRNGANPEGIIIGKHNTFVMCDEVKDNILAKFTNTIPGQDAVPLERITEALAMVNELLSNPEAMNALGLSNDAIQLDQLKTNVRGLFQTFGSQGHEQSDDASETSESEDALVEAEELEEAIPDDLEMIDADELVDETILEDEAPVEVLEEVEEVENIDEQLEQEAFAQELDEVEEAFEESEIDDSDDASDDEVALEDDSWRCTCDFFVGWGACAHTMALERILEGMLPKEALYAEAV